MKVLQDDEQKKKYRLYERCITMLYYFFFLFTIALVIVSNYNPPSSKDHFKTPYDFNFELAYELVTLIVPGFILLFLLKQRY